MTRRGLTLIEIVFGIIAVWLVVWLTSYLSAIFEMPLFAASALVVCGYVIIAQFFILMFKLTKSKSKDSAKSP